MIQRMSEKGMIIDPGHLGVIARDGALDLLEDRRYPGVISSHSWADVDSYPRIHEMGGLVTPYAGDSEGFVEAWDRKKNRPWWTGHGPSRSQGKRRLFTRRT